jgi:2-polyprenyl-3-methyl-5-hydroxy-6-metoxy-1,4-benzoquinol methylase
VLRNLDRRDLQPEVMDRPDLDRGRHVSALSGLARVNRLSRVAAGVWRPIGAFAARHALRALTVADFACGGGDVGLGVVEQARRDGVRLHLTGFDVSPTAVERARRRAGTAGIEAEFVVHDLLARPLDRTFDIVTCTLFLHHLDESQAVALLTTMRQAARRLVVVNDLLRSRLGYLAAQAVCRVVTRSEVVHYDGPQSVAAAFRLDEVRAVAERAGLGNARLKKVWPFRFLLTWETP